MRYSIRTLLIFLVIFIVFESIIVASQQCHSGAEEGCYNKDDIKSAAGTLTPSTFGHYCANSASDDKPKINDADENSLACNCIQGAAWAPVAGQACCGDDIDDCGNVLSETRFGVEVDQHLCFFDDSFIGSWVPADANNGEIVAPACTNSDFLSQNAQWFECPGTNEILEVNGHEYACDLLTESWYECCGNDFCNSQTSSKGFFTGEKVDITSFQPNQVLDSPLINTNGLVLFFPTYHVPIKETSGPNPNLRNHFSIDIDYGENNFMVNNYFNANVCSLEAASCSIYNPVVTTNPPANNNTNLFDLGQNQEITITFWINPTETYPTGDTNWFIRYEASSDNYFGVFANAAGKVTARLVIDGRSYDTTLQNRVLETGFWYFIAARANNSALSIWSHQTQHDTTTHTEDISNLESGLFHISHVYASDTSEIYHHEDTVNEITAWNRTLSDNDLEKLLAKHFTKQTFYCTSQGTFVTDLDNSDQETCEAAGYTWTGSTCCGEPEDEKNLYYNDVGGRGGCWDGAGVVSIDFIPNSEQIASFNGVFVGCDVTDESFLNLQDSYTNQPLITNVPLCFQDSEKLFVCAENRTWVSTLGNDRSVLSITPDEFNTPPHLRWHCCAQSQCWNGSVCIDDQQYNSLDPPQQGYRCINSTWTDSDLKTSPNKEFTGYCPNASDCLLNPLGDPQCIKNEQYSGNNLCEEGKWTSRTKFIALQLLELVQEGEDYTLFCDIPAKVINYLDQFISQKDLGHLFSNGSSNHICILARENQIIMGTSFDSSITEDEKAKDVWSLADCEGLVGGNQYYSCNSEEDTWYNPSLHLLLTSNTAIDLAGETGFLDTFFNFIKNPIESIVSFFRDSEDSEVHEYVYAEELTRFDKLFISNLAGKSIVGTLEADIDQNRLVIQYENFATDLCYFIDIYNLKFQDNTSSITCRFEDPTYFVASRGDLFAGINPDVIWNDLTSKLRVSNGSTNFECTEPNTYFEVENSTCVCISGFVVDPVSGTCQDDCLAPNTYLDNETRTCLCAPGYVEDIEGVCQADD